VKPHEETRDLMVAAVEELRKFFKNGSVGQKDIRRAAIGASTFATWTRLYTAEISNDHLGFMIAREVIGDKKKLAEYLRKSKPVLALPK